MLILFIEQKIENQSSERLVFETLGLFKKRNATSALVLFWKRGKILLLSKRIKMISKKLKNNQLCRYANPAYCEKVACLK